MTKLNNHIATTAGKGGKTPKPASGSGYRQEAGSKWLRKFTALFASFVIGFALSFKTAFALTLDVPTINPGDTVTLTIDATVDVGTAGQTITNLVSHTQDQNDNNNTPDDLDVDITVSNPVIGMAKLVEVSGSQVDFTFTIENMGNVALTNISIVDDLDAVFGVGSYSVNSITSSTSSLHNSGFNGSSDTELADNTATIAAGVTETISVSTTVNSISGSGNYSNQVTGYAETPGGTPTTDVSTSGTDPDPDNDGDPTNNSDTSSFTVELATKLYVSKVANRGTAQIGDYVVWTITVSNNQALPSASYNLTDTLPTGIRYVAGSSTVNGVALEPTVAGQNLVWPMPSLAGGSSAIISIKTILGSRIALGKNVNIAQAKNLAGGDLSDIARATVEVIADPTFDCSDLIGKVFEDTNQDGYQDEGEKGIAGAILYTVEGLRVNTDRHGRYHITCAMMPQLKRGSNFIIKLDESSLPEGYNITSENPRVVRMTRGKMTKANFGAFRSRKVKVAVSRKVFLVNTDKFDNNLEKGLNKLVEKLQDQDVLVVVTYNGGADEDKGLILRRLANIRKRLEQLWEEIGAEGKLAIDSKVKTKKSAKKRGAK